MGPVIMSEPDDARRDAALAAVHQLLGPVLLSLPREASRASGVVVHPYDVMAAITEQLAYILLAATAANPGTLVANTLEAVQEHLRATVQHLIPVVQDELRRVRGQETEAL